MKKPKMHNLKLQSGWIFYQTNLMNSKKKQGKKKTKLEAKDRVSPIKRPCWEI